MIEIKLNNDTSVQASLGLMALKNLRHKDKDLYKDVNRILFEGTKNIEDLTTAIYAGYVTCCKDKPEYSFEEFTNLLPDSVSELTGIIKRMI